MDGIHVGNKKERIKWLGEKGEVNGGEEGEGVNCHVENADASARKQGRNQRIGDVINIGSETLCLETR